MNTTPLAEHNAPSAQVSTKPGELQSADLAERAFEEIG
jgi:hypothetical protein